MKMNCVIVMVLSVLTQLKVPGASFSDADWMQIGSANGPVLATTVDSAGNVFVGGDFTVIEGVPANRIAKWNGKTWSSLGLSGLNGKVRAIATAGTDVYAGGDFTMAGGGVASKIAKWNGAIWTPLGIGMDYPVYALAALDGKIYAGGIFQNADNSSMRGIAMWSGSSWSRVGPTAGITNGGLTAYVTSLVTSGNDLYAAGWFSAIGGISARNVAKWNGSNWSALGSGVGSGVNDKVSAIAVAGGTVYAGGTFRDAGGKPSSGGVAANYMAKWNGNSWTALGTGTNSPVLALCLAGGNLYAGGSFEAAGGLAAYKIARWDNTVWGSLGSGVNDDVLALSTNNGRLFVGGNFATAGGKPASGLAVAIVNRSKMAVFGNNSRIDNGRTIVGKYDFTDFGDTNYPDGVDTRTFIIRNLGDTDLRLTSPKLVSVVGEPYNDIHLETPPASVIPPLGSSAFTVKYFPVRTSNLEFPKCDPVTCNAKIIIENDSPLLNLPNKKLIFVTAKSVPGG